MASTEFPSRKAFCDGFGFPLSPNRGHQRAITGGRSEAALDDAKWKKNMRGVLRKRLTSEADTVRTQVAEGGRGESQGVSGIKSNAMNCLANWRASVNKTANTYIIEIPL